MDLQDRLQKLIELMGFNDFSINREEETRRFLVFINDDVVKKFLPQFVASLDYLIKLLCQKNNLPYFFIDVNNYRREREELIMELARATARKSAAEKKEIAMPPMNAYERRLVHLELAQRPDIKTESVGEGRNRYIIIKPLQF